MDHTRRSTRLECCCLFILTASRADPSDRVPSPLVGTQSAGCADITHVCMRSRKASPHRAPPALGYELELYFNKIPICQLEGNA